MKKSEVFHKAQFAVLSYPELSFQETLEVLAVLMKEEELAKFSERREEKNNEEL